MQISERKGRVLLWVFFFFMVLALGGVNHAFPLIIFAVWYCYGIIVTTCKSALYDLDSR